MHKNRLVFFIIIIFVASCTKSPENDFLERANTFYQTALLGNCKKLETIVRYPVLMDGKEINNPDDLQKVCNSLNESGNFLEKNTGISKKDLALKAYKSGWMKTDFLKNHPLLKAHVGNGDVSVYLLEVTLINDFNNTSPLTILFRKDYERKNDNWYVIMFEDYSLTDSVNQEKGHQ